MRKPSIAKAGIDKTGEVLNTIRTVIDEISHDINTACDLHDLAIDTELSKSVEYSIEHPQETALDLMNLVEKNLLGQVLIDTEKYIKEHQDSVVSASRISIHRSSIQFVIVLKEDNVSTRYDFNKYIREFEKSAISTRIAVIFHYLTKEIHDRISDKHLVV